MSASPQLAHVAKKPDVARGSYPWYAPRFWHGMRLGHWLRLVWRHRFRIHPFRLFMALNITLVALGNSVAHALQTLLFGRKIANTPLVDTPIIILGHWRSGTTYLHELLSLNDSFTSPHTYECFCPHHFLLTSWFGPTILRPILPSKRPMDNMAFGWDRPQEDDFGLLAMGCSSPYLHCAFPNDAAEGLDSVDMTMPPDQLAYWKRKVHWFLQAITYRRPKRLVLKSPPHTGRVGILAQMYPGAKFVYIVRDPFFVFASMRKLWRTMDWAMGLQHPHHRDLDERILTAGERMLAAYELHKHEVPPENLYEVRYEDLIADPVGTLAEIYSHLQLGDFDKVRAALAEYAQSQRDYQRNRHALEADIEVEIERRWGPYFHKYGYFSPEKAVS